VAGWFHSVVGPGVHKGGWYAYRRSNMSTMWLALFRGQLQLY
jgi:hypothetical protein